MIDIYNNFYKGKRVLVTGHTGFKGSWLSIWLNELGAEVVGVALEPHSDKDNFVLSGIGSKIKADIRADIRDSQKLKDIFLEYQPEIVFHLAAQPLVRLSYDIPVAGGLRFYIIISCLTRRFSWVSELFRLLTLLAVAIVMA